MQTTRIPDVALYPLREIIKLVLTKASFHNRMAMALVSDHKGENDAFQVSKNEEQHEEEIQPEHRSDNEAGAQKACQ